MPRGKKVSQVEKETWLVKFQSGESISEIAAQANRHQSTVSKGIRQAEDEKSRAVARASMYQNTLETHNRAMVAALVRHKERLSFRPPNQIAAYHSHKSSPVRPPDFPFELEPRKFIRRDDWHVEGVHGLENELIREHLRDRVTMWRNYDKWLADHARYLWHVWRLSVDVAENFREESGLEPVRDKEGFFDSCTIRLVEASLELAGTGESEHIAKLNTDHGNVNTGNVRLAYAESQETLERAKSAFASIVRGTAEGGDAKIAAAEASRLSQSLPAIKRPFELIQAMQIVEGVCEACKPYVK